MAARLQEVVLAAVETSNLDVDGILWLEHVNLVVGTKVHADAFLLDLIGFVRDHASPNHVNLGRQQLHLKNMDVDRGGCPPHVLTGCLGLAVASLGDIRARLDAAYTALSDTEFAVTDESSSITLTCPWGGSFRLYEAVPAQHSALEVSGKPKMVRLHHKYDSSMAVHGLPGVRFVEFRARPGTTQALGAFYEHVFGCAVIHTSHSCDGSAPGPAFVRSAVVTVGPSVHLVFTDDPNQPLTDDDEHAQAGDGGSEGIHICVYAASFRKTYKRLQSIRVNYNGGTLTHKATNSADAGHPVTNTSTNGLIWTNPRFAYLDSCDTYEQAVASRTLRFRHIVDLTTGKILLELEHEVRPVRHSQFMKQL